ncbi:20122_t:CDS:1, partial [Racocetra persica]
RESLKPSTILSDTLFEIDDHLTFQDLLQQADVEYESNEIVKVEIRCVGNKQYNTVASGVKSSLILCRKDERNVSHIRFTIKDGSIQSTSSSNQLDAFNIIMERSTQRSLPPLKSSNSKRDKLYNDILSKLKDKDCGWLDGKEITIGKQFVESLTALLWELDEHHQKLHDRGCQIPEIFLTLHGYQNKQYYKKESHHKKGILQRSKLELLVEAVEKCITQPWAGSESWNEFINEVFMLISCVQKYILYLEHVSNSVNTIRNAVEPARNPVDNSNIEIRIECFRQNLKECYKLLATKMHDVNDYEVVLLDEYLPVNKYE